MCPFGRIFLICIRYGQFLQPSWSANLEDCALSFLPSGSPERQERNEGFRRDESEDKEHEHHLRDACSDDPCPDTNRFPFYLPIGLGGKRERAQSSGFALHEGCRMPVSNANKEDAPKGTSSLTCRSLRKLPTFSVNVES